MGDQLIDDGKVMSVWDHLSELRNRVVKALLGVLAGFVIALSFSDSIIAILKKPLVNVLPPGTNALHFTGPLDVFMVDMKVAFLVSVVFTCPIWLHQFWKFFEPALYPHERKFILPFLIASVLVFFLGVSFCYFLILPFSLEYLINIGMEVGVPMITIKDYISLLTLLIFGFGLIFETPVLIVLLAMLDIVTLEGLKAYRRFVVVAILIISAVIVPPDPISLVALATPVYGMYELAIIVIGLLKNKQVQNNPVT